LYLKNNYPEFIKYSFSQMNRSFSVLVYATQHMKIGGIESHLQEFCNWLSSKGVDIDLIVLNADMLPETEEFYKRTCRRYYAGKQRKTYRRIIWLFITKFKTFGRRYNAVYTNGQGESIQLFAKMFSLGNNWVHHYHQSCEPEDQLTWGRSYRRSLAKADLLIACSKSIANKLYSALKRPIEVIPCFSKEVSITSKEVIKGEKLKLGYYGRLIPEKGVDILCQLSEDEDFAHVEFHIWGQGPAYPPEFFLGYPNILYHGPFSGEKELATVIGSLHAYLLISKNPEALPIVLLEVMSTGLPWFALDRGGIPDIFHDIYSTRIIAASSNYEEIKIALLDFAAAIGSGKVNHGALKEAYQKKFSHEVLVQNWLKTLSFSSLPA
jgi:glycosyltransferase involved in cell wall biosynthesis